MDRHWSEDERVAALLDGRLSEREREEMLSHLVADDGAYQGFVVLAAVLRQAEKEVRADAEAPLPLEMHREAGRGAMKHLFALAAVLAGLTLVPGSLLLSGRSSAAADPVRLAAQLTEANGLPAWWNEPLAWSAR